LEFSQKQIDQDRSFYKHLYTIAAYFIALMVGLGIFVTNSSISQMRTDMQTTINGELSREKLEITDAIRDAKLGVAKELQNVRTEVQKHVVDEFQSANIANLVARAAKE
jgi:signal transduction histidine kinase